LKDTSEEGVLLGAVPAQDAKKIMRNKKTNFIKEPIGLIYEKLGQRNIKKRALVRAL